MINVISRIACWFTFSALIIFCSGKNSIFLTQIMSESMNVRKKAIINQFCGGKKSIPTLIDDIQRGPETANELTNPTSSIMQEDNLRIFLGAYAAYMIELILAKEELDMKDFYRSDLLLGSSKNYIFWNGFIVNRNGDCVSRNQREMDKIALIYKKWWGANNEKPLEQLRNEWKNNIRPLSGSGYHWE